MPLKNDLFDTGATRSKSDSSMTRFKGIGEPEPESKSLMILKGVLFVAFLASFIMFLVNRTTMNSSVSANLKDVIKNEVLNDAPDSKILAEMGAWMERMGYTNLTNQDLLDLRKKGVTATFTARIRDLGYEPTLDELIQLAQHDVTATFASMMHALGYKDLKIEDLIRLRVHGVTAHYTSNLHDLGYTDITPDDLIRLKDARVSINDVKKINKDRSLQKATIDELVRYGISNQ